MYQMLNFSQGQVCSLFEVGLAISGMLLPICAEVVEAGCQLHLNVVGLHIVDISRPTESIDYTQFQMLFIFLVLYIPDSLEESCPPTPCPIQNLDQFERNQERFSRGRSLALVVCGDNAERTTCMKDLSSCTHPLQHPITPSHKTIHNTIS